MALQAASLRGALTPRLQTHISDRQSKIRKVAMRQHFSKSRTPFPGPEPKQSQSCRALILRQVTQTEMLHLGSGTKPACVLWERAAWSECFPCSRPTSHCTRSTATELPPDARTWSRPLVGSVTASTSSVTCSGSWGKGMRGGGGACLTKLLTLVRGVSTERKQADQTFPSPSPRIKAEITASRSSNWSCLHPCPTQPILNR